MFIPMRMTFGAGEHQSSFYDRQIELTNKQLLAFERASGDMTEPLVAIGKDLRRSVDAAFASQGATGATGPWAPLSLTYGHWKESQVPGVPILVGLRATGMPGSRPQTYAPSGEMRRELLDPAATYIGPRRLLYLPLSDIAGWHETGTPTMPARPPVDVSLPFLHSIDRAFARWLAVLMKKLGL